MRIFSREGNKEGEERSEQVYWREDRREGGVKIQGKEETNEQIKGQIERKEGC